MDQPRKRVYNEINGNVDQFAQQGMTLF